MDMDFEKQGYVSVWVGQFESDAAFQNYITHTFDEDGNAHSPFGHDSQLEWFDHDFQDAEFFSDGISDLGATLASASYGDSFAEHVAAEIQARNLLPFNAIFLLYDCAYSAELAHDEQKLRFVGAFPYQK
jgi:hypothetical protein